MGIKDIHIVSDEYKLVSKKWKAKPTSVDLGDGIFIKDGEMAIITGPCSIESEDQIRQNGQPLRGIQRYHHDAWRCLQTAKQPLCI
jgi:3-deoxy-D-arabino-heptulosonate 7-phosphate (DAHP) synthase